jgi:transcriptional regulator with XRE-family HTH domain
MKPETFRTIRKILHLSQEEVAAGMFTTKQLVSSVERGISADKKRLKCNLNYWRLWYIEYLEKNKENIHEGAYSICYNLLKEMEV